jgi:hypothetical protein
LITEFEFAQDQDKPPKLIVHVAETGDVPSITGIVKVDLGQLTTVWPREDVNGPQEFSSVLRQVSTLDPIPLNQMDELLDRLYDASRPDQGKRGGWTKKELQKRIDQIPTSVSFATKDLVEATLRQVAKAGRSHIHLIDSNIVLQSLPKSDSPALYKRAQVASILGEHGNGRFKRFPSLFVSSDPTSGILQIVNGGWIAVDSAVRASKEAESLAAIGASRGTNADERIIQRLENLAMGTATSSASSSRTSQISEEDLQVDVREYLKTLDLPCTSEGAKQALVDMGLWSSLGNGKTQSQFKPQPWSPEILEAVEWYRTMDSKRKQRLAQSLSAIPADSKSIEGRKDLTHLPCICVDATRTSFRDDAMGVRPRASTGRKVIESSKWEILFHTVDVSDLYAPAMVDRAEQLRLLQSAASKRGSSRYDLPSGPLHLLPPALLEALALDVARPTDSPAASPTVNRCTTTWVYLDDASGKILDAGMERTLISSPLALTFQSASELLDDDKCPQGEGLEGLKKAKILLNLIEREVLRWKDGERQRSASASKARDDRLMARQQIDALIFGDSDRDDGRDGFKQTRGHRLVDACLDLQGLTLTSLVRTANYSLPFVAGAQRDGRVATAPLRRYIDGVAQWQALAVLCGYGGNPYSRQECTEIGLKATKAINAVSNIQSFKTSTTAKSPPSRALKQLQAARALKHVLSTSPNPTTFPAVSTGKDSEVVILEVGAIAFCEGIRGTLRPGEKILVSIRDIDPSSGRIRAACVDATGTGKQTMGPAHPPRRRTRTKS